MIKNILLIGDSLTAGFDDSLLPGFTVLNKGVSGNSAEDVLKRFDRNWFATADIAFLCIGTNDMAQGYSDEQILGNIDELAGKMSLNDEDTISVIFSVFPTRDNDPRPLDRIAKLNKGIENIAAEHHLVYYDQTDLFADANGKLKKEFTEDGLHLTEAGYKKWAEVILEIVKELSE